MAGLQGKIWIFMAVVIVLNALTWFYARDVRARWLNVPPPPGEAGGGASGLGDRQFAYRSIGIMLQNMGDTGGRVTSLSDYNYDDLASWFMLQHKLDPRSNFIPLLAAFYFGGAQEPENLAPIVKYLRVAGNSEGVDKWRWLAQAIYLARFKMNDLDKAYEMALELAAIRKDDMPAWTRQMPAFILSAKGDKEAAYAILVELLKSGSEDMHPAEVNFMLDYICKRILDEEEAQGHSLCQNINLDIN